jgi:hypothetical protein
MYSIKTAVFEWILEKYHLRLRVDYSGSEYEQLAGCFVHGSEPW